MELHFCDLCNESVPQLDLDQGRAVRRSGRVVCATCEEAMSAAPSGSRAPAPAAAETRLEEERLEARPVPVALPEGSRRGGGLALGLAILALFGTAAGATYLVERLRGEERRLAARMDDLLGDERHERRLLDARMDHRFAGLDAALARLDEDQTDELAKRIGDVEEARRDELRVLREDVARVAARLEEIAALRPFLDRHERELGRLGTTLADLDAEVRRLGSQARSGQELASGAREPGKAARPAGSDVRPDWWPVLDELKSQSSGTRWQAVQTLGNTGDPDTAEHLVPMLQDPDIFVRMATARILGDLAAVVGIPALIGALEDSEASVREAAVVSLRGITGQNFRFDPTARENERSKRVRAWEDWWKKASKDLLGSKTFERGEG